MIYACTMEQSLRKRITTIPGLCGGRPTIRGMRIRVADILDYMAGGESRASLLKEFKELQDEDITAALLFAAEAINQQVKLPEEAA
jgi:uncharacterized protein (DUF433 family)